MIKLRREEWFYSPVEWPPWSVVPVNWKGWLFIISATAILPVALIMLTHALSLPMAMTGAMLLIALIGIFVFVYAHTTWEGR